MPARAPSPRSTYDLLLALTCLVFVLSNIAATKGVALGPVITDGGFFLFPLAYVLGDLLAEVFGLRAARRAILASFAAGLLAALVFWVVVALPPAGFYEGQDALAQVLGPVPQVLAGSLLGFLVGQLLNASVLVALKNRTRGRHLWLRLLGSTALGEAVDTLIFCLVAAPVIGVTTVPEFLVYAGAGYVYKVAVEVLLLPVTYRAVRWLRDRERQVAGDAGGREDPGAGER